MAIAQHTGRTRTALCYRCNLDVLQHETVTYGQRTTRDWATQRHTAPCGLPCRGGPVAASSFRAGQMHGDEQSPCPVCGVVYREGEVS